MTSLSVIRANMATDPDMNFYMGTLPSSLHSSQVVSFQSASVSDSSMIFPTDCSGGVSCGAGMPMTRSPGVIGNASTMTQPGSCSSNLLLDSMQGLIKNDTGLAADWSYEEQIILETGLLKYVNEPNMMKYIKIAASLPEKTVRDVALRCRWMTKKENGKRRKQEEYYAGKKMKDRKEKLFDSSFTNISPCQPANFATYSYTMPYIDHTQFAAEVPVVDGATQCRIEENNLLFQQIEDNFQTFKLQDNINLLCHSRNNITSILSSMREMPGIMSQMPPLPIQINEEVADALLLRINQQLMFGPPGGNS